MPQSYFVSVTYGFQGAIDSQDAPPYAPHQRWGMPWPRDSKDRLRALDARIAALKPKDEQPHTETHYSQANMAWRMVIELVAGLGIGFCIGLGLDTVLGTKPILMVVFIFFGLAAGVVTMMRTANEIGAKQADKGLGTDLPDDDEEG